MKTQHLSRGARLGSAALVLGLAMSVMTPQASALTLYEQAPIDGADGFTSGSQGIGQTSDNFALGATSGMETISWWGRAYDDQLQPIDDPIGMFTIRLFANDAGFPAADPPLFETGSVAVSRGPSNPLIQDSAGNDIFEYSFALASPILLSANTYYVSVLSDEGNFAWYWQTAGDGVNWFRAADNDPWTPEETKNLAFRIDGQLIAQVPEPETLSLLFFAVGGLLVMGARRAKRK